MSLSEFVALLVLEVDGDGVSGRSRRGVNGEGGALLGAGGSGLIALVVSSYG